MSRRRYRGRVAGLGIAFDPGTLRRERAGGTATFLRLRDRPPPLVAAEQACAGLHYQVVGARAHCSGPPPPDRRHPEFGRPSAARCVPSPVVVALGCRRADPARPPPYPHVPISLEREPRRRGPTRELGWDFVPARSVVAEERAAVCPQLRTPPGTGWRCPGRGRRRGGRRSSHRENPMLPGFGPCLGGDDSVRVGALARDTKAPPGGVRLQQRPVLSLRLAAELPRFREPVPCDAGFRPSLVRSQSPRQSPAPGKRDWSWQPADQHWRLAALLRWLIPTVQRCRRAGHQRARDSLRAPGRSRSRRGAEPLIVVPQNSARRAPPRRCCGGAILDGPDCRTCT